mmetsp:Transcript_29581/g.74302  ORF Transcript_29581/g.74302 Transcript_29581/m.74302 type:complete len:203 (+) Transcript_29581:142-750(+)
MKTARVDPKAWFSAERTFLHWAKISVVFAASAALLLAGAGTVPKTYNYFEVNVGTCDYPITSGRDCSAAASVLGVSPLAARGDGLVGSADAPPYCYAEDGIMKFNPGSNRGICSEEKTCLCQEAERDWYIYGPAAVVGVASLLVLGHAYRKHIRRTRSMGSEGRVVVPADFADRGGSYMLAVTLTLAILGLVTAPVLGATPK